MRRFLGLWEHNRTREIAAVERVGGWLGANVPESGAGRRSSTATTAWATRCSRPSAPARLVAVFDWEMATIGDPLADVGYLCATVERAPTTRRCGMFELSARHPRARASRRATS